MNVTSLIRTDWDIVQMDPQCRRAAQSESEATSQEQRRAVGLEWFTPPMPKRITMVEKVVKLNVPPSGQYFSQDLDSPMLMLKQKPSDAEKYDIIKNEAVAESGQVR